MGPVKKGFPFSSLLFALLLAAESAFVLDMLTTRAVTNLPAVALALAFAAFLALFVSAALLRPRWMKYLFLTVTALILLAVLALALIWYWVYKTGPYQAVAPSKEQIFAGKRVMAIVPHEDDEMNLLGGVIEQYVKYGSDVYIVYVTNGDLLFSAEQRITEAEAAMASCGIPASHLIFLGYGDAMSLEGKPFYYCPEDQQLYSPAGFSETYGTSGHPAFNPGHSYTRLHVQEDIRDVILRYMPDVIYCTDMDEHYDHQAVAMLFERAMGQVLARQPAYAPQVFRGFAYDTAYYAPTDYYRVNIASTQKPNSEPYMTSGSCFIYNWEERIRLPVDETGFSRSLLSSSAYETLCQYSSQPADIRSEGIINGDKVFWQRESNSLSYDAWFWVSSGDESVLHDFVLIDRELEQTVPGFSVNTWIPEPDDQEKRVIIKFSQPTALSRVVLYDNPSLVDNVLETSIRLDNGTFIKSGPLDPNGSGTELLFDRAEVEELEICLLETEGSGAGLTEIELFSEEYTPPFRFIKLMNTQGDFIYDYYIDPSGQEEFLLYAYGCSDQLADYRIICIGDGCYASIEDNKLIMNCAQGKNCTLSLMDESGQIFDTVHIRNRDLKYIQLAQKLETYVRKEFKWGANSNTAILINTIRTYIGEVFQ